MLRIKLEKSLVGHNWRRRRTAEALGLRKIRQVVEHSDTPAIRGMVHAIHDLVSVETVAGEAGTPKAAKPAKAEAKPAAEKKPKAAATPEAKPKKTAKKDTKENS